MRPRLTIPLTPEDKAVCARWSRRVLGRRSDSHAARCSVVAQPAFDEGKNKISDHILEVWPACGQRAQKVKCL
jgi:hypothetical protein